MEGWFSVFALNGLKMTQIAKLSNYTRSKTRPPLWVPRVSADLLAQWGFKPNRPKPEQRKQTVNQPRASRLGSVRAPDHSTPAPAASKNQPSRTPPTNPAPPTTSRFGQNGVGQRPQSSPYSRPDNRTNGQYQGNNQRPGENRFNGQPNSGYNRPTGNRSNGQSNGGNNRPADTRFNGQPNAGNHRSTENRLNGQTNSGSNRPTDNRFNSQENNVNNHPNGQPNSASRGADHRTNGTYNPGRKEGESNTNGSNTGGFQNGNQNGTSRDNGRYRSDQSGMPPARRSLFQEPLGGLPKENQAAGMPETKSPDASKPEQPVRPTNDPVESSPKAAFNQVKPENVLQPPQQEIKRPDEVVESTKRRAPWEAPKPPSEPQHGKNGLNGHSSPPKTVDLPVQIPMDIPAQLVDGAKGLRDGTQNGSSTPANGSVNPGLTNNGAAKNGSAPLPPVFGENGSGQKAAAPNGTAPRPTEFEKPAVKPSKRSSISLEQLLERDATIPTEAALLGVCDDSLPVLLDLNDPTPGALLLVGDEREQHRELLRTAVISAVQRNSPRSVQFLVITDDPQTWNQWIAAQGYDRHCLAVEERESQGAREWIMRLADWTEQRRTQQRSGPAVLALIDTLDFLPRLPYDVRLNFDWMVKEAPPARIWPIASITTNLALSIGSRMLRSFQGRVFGYACDSAVYSRLGNVEDPDSADIARPGEFAVRVGDDWLRFQVPTKKA